MSSTGRKTAKLFLADYTTDENFLISPNRDHGMPGLLQARDPEGRQVLVKTWVRNPGTTGSDLEQIWRSEIRQLQRLAAVPRAEDLFVPMLTSGEDAEGFHLVLDPGHGSPLEIFRRAKNPPAAMVQPRLPRNRRRLWANALRAAEALELLHSQGIIHRNIDPWASRSNSLCEPVRDRLVVFRLHLAERIA
jgi:serine/threonine protein kinase